MALYLLLYYILQIWSLNKDNYTLVGILLLGLRLLVGLLKIIVKQC
jgi:hypothetical protein